MKRGALGKILLRCKSWDGNSAENAGFPPEATKASYQEAASFMAFVAADSSSAGHVAGQTPLR
ncbi:hypothetical protein EYZ11_002691 [Aspergillus tanneri]|uniref:Uncharacterized protein n=1 Tax=Aspergillus tanneri TaxID=1220188 RepID=A0A4S3JSA4_9EURO|nr:hypothetical protein EYZ11_002691 [Aspergillus tanneri]